MKDLLLALSSSIVALIALMYTAHSNNRMHKKADFERVSKAIEYVSTGEIAEARHTLANFVINNSKIDASGIATPSSEQRVKSHDGNSIKESKAIDSAFKIIWALNFIHGIDESLKHSGIFTISRNKPQILLRNSLKSFITWHLGPLPEGIDNNKAVLVQIDKSLDLKSGDLNNLKKWAYSIYEKDSDFYSKNSIILFNLCCK